MKKIFYAVLMSLTIIFTPISSIATIATTIPDKNDLSVANEHLDNLIAEGATNKIHFLRALNDITAAIRNLNHAPRISEERKIKILWEQVKDMMPPEEYKNIYDNNAALEKRYTNLKAVLESSRKKRSQAMAHLNDLLGDLDQNREFLPAAFKHIINLSYELSEINLDFKNLQICGLTAKLAECE
ncbi:MAG: hypothetical protein GY793_09975 [Proteobacteria bacterium]|nr:hypothetical protein [Pseudomonadota bacterium]